MCNPPFYESTDELLSLAKEKQRPPFSACTGAEVEMVTPGGEVAFVKRMIEESQTLKERVEWYTSMLGKYGSVSAIIPYLKERNVTNYAVTEFVHGTKTRRWALGWSWGDMRPSVVFHALPHSSCLRSDLFQKAARGISSLPKSLLPFPSEFDFVMSGISIDVVGQRVNSALEDLGLQWQWKPAMAMGVGFADGNVWSRASRRRQKRAKEGVEDMQDESSDSDEAALGFKIQLTASKESKDVNVIIRWLKGNDSVLFESFCGMLKRKVSSEG
ncbi:MAG: hypothetical protein M4579_003801 [Chaenotheca gracillima]|nr:MAG: hypothetical protein M4579_003801 [Chaenotheca gracillima]